DTIAAAMDRDRSYVLNEAISAYLELYRWQRKHIKEGIRQANAGELASDKEVAQALGRKSQ
ncbi:MAG TPA: CopG family transcriptional regulator, partial [Deltaproteobacteria bacterium]|nr:CopG family transcriptional regulator [Deltaproteobacteria bacterium]